MTKDPFALSGSELLNPSMGKGAVPHKEIFAKPKGGGGGLGRARKPSPTNQEPESEPLDMTGGDKPAATKEKSQSKAVLKKIDWVKSETLFNTDAEVSAEFEIPESEKNRTLVDFQLLENMDGEYIIRKRAQGHADAAGRAKTSFSIEKGDKPESTFALKAKHCSADDFEGPRAVRVVTETATISFERTQVSGLHFPKNSSFIGDEFLETLCELKKTYLDWKKTHDKAQIIVYGHAEADRDGEPHSVSKSRGQSAFLFIIGDVEGWTTLAEKERWGVWEQQCMLRALGFFHVKPTGTRGPKTRAATEKFFAFLEKERGKKFNPMLGFTEAYIRKELYREYMNLNRSEIELPSSVFRLVSGFPYVGCSAFNCYIAGAELHDENRRVVFVILQETPNFPMAFPCRSGSIGPCEDECKKPGERAIQGFGCKYYDDMVKQEKVGAAATSGNGHEIETHWKGKKGILYPNQNDYNDDIYAAAKKYDLPPRLFKSLIAQESGFDVLAANDVGFAGLTQVGGDAITEVSLKTGTTAKLGKKWVFDFKGDERFDPKKSIEAGAHALSIKRSRVIHFVLSKFTQQPSEEEKWKFYLAAYNAGEGVVLDAWKENGRVDCVWEDLLEGEKESPVYKIIPKSYGDRLQKYNEIADYATSIMQRKDT